MNRSLNESSGKYKGYIAWGSLGILTLLAFFCTYHFELATAVQAIVWLGWFLLSMVLFYFTTQGKQAFQFSKEARIEMQKVVWPSRPETVQTTMIVMAMVAVTGFVLWGIDVSMMWIIGKITHLG